MQIVCTVPRGFETSDKEIRVFDTTGRPIYVFNNVKRPVTRFNLPKGVYVTQNNLKPLKAAIVYDCKMPKFERDIKRPKKIVVKYGNNPNKATIVLERGLILIDNSFKAFPPFVNVYVIFHELGHYRFKSEIGADAYARVQMLKRGYNPSQIGMASRLTLSPKSNARLMACYDSLKKIK